MAITKVSRGLLNTGVSDSSDATAITINSSEQVGIGTTSPVATLQVKTQADGNLAFQNSTSVTGGVKLNCFNDAANASSPFEIDGSTLQFNIGASEKMRIDSSGKVGIGTDAIPHGGVGAAKFAIDGGNQNFTTGPHVQFTTDADDHPVMQILNYGHDNVSINFDTYHNGTGWTSADAGSNFQLYKLSNQLTVRSASGVSAGSAITFTNSLAIDPNGQLYFNSGAGNLKAYGVRAWVNFDGTASSISPRGAGNVGSITDHGVGQYTCNFTTAMPDTNYVIFGSGGHTAESNQICVSQNRGATAPATGSCRISVTYANSYLIDVGQVTVAFIR